jgi:hypothetical protein
MEIVAQQELPPGTGGVAVLAAVGGAAIGGAVSGIWTTTPPSWREGIYSWTEDGSIVVGDIGENVGDWFVDRWMDLSGDVPR